MEPQRLAVIDLGSNSFRLVVFTYTPEWWRRTDEIFEAVRIGAGLDESGAIAPEAMERALETVELFAHFCQATGITDIRPVATSAIRDATNQSEFLTEAKRRAGLDVRVLAREEEARYGYLAAVTSTTLTDGVALDIGGGSMQLTRVEATQATDARSWRLGAVRMTERFGDDVDALRKHVAKKLEKADWVGGGRLVGVGGTVRNLAAAVMHEQELPTHGIQGFRITRKALDRLVDKLAELSPADRRKVSGIKPERGDLILAGATVIQSVVAHGDFDAIEATEAGLREGVFFAERPPQSPDVRGEAVRNLAALHDTDFAHAEHVCRLALEIWDALAPDDAVHRELLAAAAMLHDIGTTIDYDDHHKHSRYLILNGHLPGFNPAERAFIAQVARYHRKGNPTADELEPLLGKASLAALPRAAAALRIAEQLERPRDQSVRAARPEVANGAVTLRLEATGDTTVSRWAAERHADMFEKAYGRTLTIEGP